MLEPETAVALQLDRGLYDSKEQLLAASQVGTMLDGVGKGAYVVRDVDGAEAVIVATGSEVSVAVAAAEQLDVRVRVALGAARPRLA